MVEGNYTCGTSAVPLLGMTIGEMVDNIAAKYPDSEAIVSIPRISGSPTASFLTK